MEGENRRRERRMAEDAQLEAEGTVMRSCSCHLKVVLITMGRKDLTAKEICKESELTL